MPKHRPVQTATMVDRIARALAKADDAVGEAGSEHYRRLAINSLKVLMVPTETMIDAAHAAVWFDGAWAIDNRRDFRRAVRAMITRAITEGEQMNG